MSARGRRRYGSDAVGGGEGSGERVARAVQRQGVGSHGAQPELAERRIHLESVGEMADADFGYVGGAPGKVDLYVGKEVVQKAIPNEEACDALVELIKEHGMWKEPEPADDEAEGGAAEEDADLAVAAAA